MPAPVAAAIFNQVNSSATNTYTTTLSGLADNDFLIAFIATSAQPTMTTPASGWAAEVARTTHTGGAFWVYTDVVTDAGTYDTTPTWVLSANNKGILMILRVTGADTAGQIDVSGTTATGSDASCEVTAVTTTQVDTLLVGCVAQEGQQTFTPPPTNPAAWTEEDDQATTGGAVASRTSMSVATLEWSGSGGTGTPVFTSSASDDWITYMLAVAPAAAAGGGAPLFYHHLRQMAG